MTSLVPPLTPLLASVAAPDWSEGLHVKAPSAAAPALLAAAAVGTEQLTVVVCATGNEAESLVSALAGYMPADELAYFPSWETLPHERLSPRSDTVARRIATLRRIVHPDQAAAETGLPVPRIMIVPLRAALQPLVPGLADLEPVRVEPGQRLDLTELTHKLAGAAYTRVDMVERRGEFAVRGGIVDVFAPTDPHPARIEFWGDEVESVRSFSVADQRSLADLPHVWAPPCRELLLTEDVRKRADALQSAMPTAADVLARLADGVAVEGMESLVPVLVDSLEPLVSVLPRGSRIVALEPERLARRAEDLHRTAAEFLAAAWVGAAAGADRDRGRRERHGWFPHRG